MKNYNFKKMISLIVLVLFIITMLAFIADSFKYITDYNTMLIHFDELIISESVIGNATSFCYETFFDSIPTNFSVYGSLIFGSIFYYLIILGIPFLILWLILRVMYLITTFGGKINV